MGSGLLVVKVQSSSSSEILLNPLGGTIVYNLDYSFKLLQYAAKKLRFFLLEESKLRKHSVQADFFIHLQSQFRNRKRYIPFHRLICTGLHLPPKIENEKWIIISEQRLFSALYPPPTEFCTFLSRRRENISKENTRGLLRIISR